MFGMRVGLTALIAETVCDAIEPPPATASAAELWLGARTLGDRLNRTVCDRGGNALI